MIITAVIAVAVVALLGLAVRYLLRFLTRRDIFLKERRVTWSEYAVITAISAVLVTPTILLWGSALSIDNKLTYQEMYNGVEVAATVSVVDCVAGHSGESYSAGQSNCSYTYVSGRYSWDETYTDTECTTNSKGELSCRPVTKCCVTYYADIYTPYAKQELRYHLTDSLGGSYDFTESFIAKDAQAYGSMAIPSNIPRGAPDDWLDARRHLDAGDPRPVTRMFDYDNYILASQDELLQAYGDVESFQGRNLLPDHTVDILRTPIYGDTRTQAKKLSFVGAKVPNEAKWQDSLMRFNAALGSKLQGDLHVVVIDSKLVGMNDSQRYLSALRAYWLGDHFGKRALSKNGVILVIGTDGKKIDWAKAATGMPFGNNVMLRTMENLLVDKPFTPEAVFGSPRTVVTPAVKEGEVKVKQKVDVTLSQPQSALEMAMFGEATKFKRPCMACEGEEDAGQVGYKNLIDKIEPSVGAKALMVVVVGAISLIGWLIVSSTSFLERGNRHKKQPRQARYNAYRY